MELCIQYAKERNNLSIERIAERMGMASHWTLYKWLESGKMPANLIRPFEHACGAQFVTKWIGSSAHKLVIDMPKAKAANNDDMLQLQTGFNAALNTLAEFYQGNAEVDQTIAQLTQVMADVAGHRANVESIATPELALFDGEEESL